MTTYKVYKITNLINNKIYVGITQEQYLSHRFWYHANRKRSSGAYLHWSIQKYGKENFTIDLLNEYNTPDESKRREVELISLWRLNRHLYPDGIGMNLTNGGDGSYGCKHSLESIQKMSGKNNHNHGMCGDKHPRSKAIMQFTLKDEYIQTFASMHEAARNIRPCCTYTQACSIVTNIRSSIIGRMKAPQAYGYKWKYA